MATRISYRNKTMSLGWIPPTPLQFNKIKTTLPTDKAILSHTSFITPLSKSVAVVADISRVNRQLDQLLADGDSGLLAISLLAKPFDGCYETISVWRDSKSLVNFYAKGTHGKVMKNWKKFLTQEPFERSDVVRYSISFGDIPQTQSISDLYRFWRQVKAGEGMAEWKR